MTPAITGDHETGYADLGTQRGAQFLEVVMTCVRHIYRIVFGILILAVGAGLWLASDILRASERKAGTDQTRRARRAR